MPNTPRLGWPYPTENQDPWWAPFVDLLVAQDSTAFAAMEDRNVILMGGGDVSWDATSGELDWSSAIELTSPITGFRTTISPATKEVADGAMLFVELSRGLTANATLTTDTASALPPTVDLESFFVLAVRRGDRVYFRNGAFLDDGESREIFGGGSSSAETTVYNDGLAAPALAVDTVQEAIDALKAFHRPAYDVQDVVPSGGARAALGNGLRYWPLANAAEDTLLFQVRFGLGGLYAVHFSYAMGTSHAGNVAFRIAFRKFGEDADPTEALSDAAIFTVTPGSNTDVHLVTDTDSLTLLTNTIQPGTVVLFRLKRANDAADTHTGEARILGISIVPTDAFAT